MALIVRQSCINNMFNHWVVPCNCRCGCFLGNMGGSPNPVARRLYRFTVARRSVRESRSLTLARSIQTSMLDIHFRLRRIVHSVTMTSETTNVVADVLTPDQRYIHSNYTSRYSRWGTYRCVIHSCYSCLKNLQEQLTVPCNQDGIQSNKFQMQVDNEAIGLLRALLQITCNPPICKKR